MIKMICLLVPELVMLLVLGRISDTVHWSRMKQQLVCLPILFFYGIAWWFAGFYILTATHAGEVGYILYWIWKNRPRGKRKSIRKAIGERTRAIFERMAEAFSPERGIA